MPLSIDINCDLGESYGESIVGNDDAIFPYITSCNIACGFHGGDPAHMARTVRNAIHYGVQIGAHPSYPDRTNFGRKNMLLPADELKSIIRYQIAALSGVTRALGGRVTYVKPHGALYNTAAIDPHEARVTIEAILSMNEDLALMGLAGSVMESAAKETGIPFIAEAFADRRYHSDGTLVSRTHPHAVISDPEEALFQVLSIVLDHSVLTIDKTQIPIHAKSICVHGDHQHTLEILQTLDKVLQMHGIQKHKF